MLDDEQIVSQLYAVEVKLKQSQQRAKNYTDQNRKGKAESFNKRVENVREQSLTPGPNQNSQEKLELERLNKVV